MAISLREIFRRPAAVAEHITDTQFGVTLTTGEHGPGRVVFYAAFRPPAAFERTGYPTDTARLEVSSGGDIRAIPTGPPRRWRHRNTSGELCLWYEEDPRELRWEWEDGFGAYIQIVHRHLVYEEFYRREGRWPVEAAPHGRGNHRIQTLQTHWKKTMWRR